MCSASGWWLFDSDAQPFAVDKEAPIYGGHAVAACS